MWRYHDKSNSQLVARCLFTHGEVEYINLEKYYERKDNK